MVNGFGSVSAAVSILVAPAPAPDNAAHAAAASPPRPRSAAVAIVGSAVAPHSNTVIIAVHTRRARGFVIIGSSHRLFWRYLSDVDTVTKPIRHHVLRQQTRVSHPDRRQSPSDEPDPVRPRTTTAAGELRCSMCMSLSRF